MSPLFAAAVAEGFLFYPLAGITLGGAFSMLFARNPIYAVMSLILTFFGIAGIYVLLAAQLLAALQIIVYAGAILVLFLFVLMLLSLGEEDVGKRKLTLGGGIGAVAVLAFWVLSLKLFTDLPNQAMPATLSAGFGEVAGVGRLIFNEFLLPFEATSVLLTVAIVGAVVVAKARI